MEEKNFSSDSEMEIEYVNETEMLKSGYFQDLLREKIRDALYEERKKNKKLDKILFDVEIVKFNRFKDKNESLSKLEDWIKLYSLIKDTNEKNVDIKSLYYKYLSDLLNK